MNKEFRQVSWDDALAHECRDIVRLAIREDLERAQDWTTLALVPAAAPGRARIVARQGGVLTGLKATRVAIEELECPITWTGHVDDGASVEPNTEVAEISGPARDLLTAERLVLNIIGRMSGIATLTRQYVDAVTHTRARIYDTRKTTPGWRGLEKYAVRCGGGVNHRRGLYEAILIKDNHLAFGASDSAARSFTPAQAVERARHFLREMLPTQEAEGMIVEVEIDSLNQLDPVLTACPDIVLLDNMNTTQLRDAVTRRDRRGSSVQLEASGGARLDTVAAIAETGVDRISVGAITHSAPSLDVAMQWG